MRETPENRTKSCPVFSSLSGECFPSRGTRDLAVESTKDFPPGTLGHAVHSAVRPAYAVFGNLWSGDIGHHYQEPETQSLLGQPATPENIEHFARRETQWWREQTGGAGAIGGSFPAEWRAAILKITARAA